MLNFILASSSPRRRELLKNLGLDFQVIASNFNEESISSSNPIHLVQELAYNKALSVKKKVCKDALILGADTIVLKEGILGKPKNEKEAYEILKSLSGGCHRVITGFSIISTYSMVEFTGYEITKVFFKELTEEDILTYISTGEPMDKAGAYGLQGRGSLFVSRIEGDYFNVVGLPLFKLNEALEDKFSFKLLR
ncbi:septum formation inhibitor Maf [Alkaliphilus pronyensis]|uniref:dTTP/UTP pyrophosphatase n=1 Tax=Alkaliphilus pronyensis TaxID=1482732 RepID=A0A6I0F1S8_9FIRM|nr:nucleoside triphosphate pyrophosphatase [Alkaliphilus pronyensis]KAB3535917.1 septum formation inhibitor Maf [Alkaliphilus pronyensis]